MDATFMALSSRREVPSDRTPIFRRRLRSGTLHDVGDELPHGSEVIGGMG